MGKKSKKQIKAQQKENTQAQPSAAQNSEDKNDGIQQLLQNKISELQGNAVLSNNEAKELERKRKSLLSNIAKVSDSSAEPGSKVKQLKELCLSQVEETLATQRKVYVLERQQENIVNAYDRLEVRFNKTDALKTKLESLCRELQKQNATVIEESRRVAAEEARKRQELTDRFQESLGDISSKIDAQSKEREQQIKENAELRSKLEQFAKHFEMRDRQYEQEGKAHDIERQLWEAKVAQQQELAKAEANKSVQYADALNKMKEKEKQYQKQIIFYSTKFEDLNETLSKSNETFKMFKTEMNKMTKRIVTLETENKEMKDRCGKANLALLEAVQERDRIAKSKGTLENLCRKLQEERKELKERLEQNGSEIIDKETKPEEETKSVTTVSYNNE